MPGLRALWIAGLMVLAGMAHAGTSAVPTFRDYPAKVVQIDKPARAVIDTREARLYRTRLREGVKEPADFAGEYVLVLFGCGTDCLYGAAISRRTGRAVFLPGVACCWFGAGSKVLYQTDSRLLILNGLLNEGGAYATRYYEFTGREFKLVRLAPRDEAYDKSGIYDWVCNGNVPGEHDDCTTRRVGTDTSGD